MLADALTGPLLRACTHTRVCICLHVFSFCAPLQADRVAYLCNKQAKVVAMTCTHAALKRREFLNLGLKYDNIVMEEAGQVGPGFAGA